MYGKEGHPKISKKCLGKLAMLLAENSDNSEEEDEFPTPSMTPWHADFNKYLDDAMKDILSGMSLVQWWCVRFKYMFSLNHLYDCRSKQMLVILSEHHSHKIISPSWLYLSPVSMYFLQLESQSPNVGTVSVGILLRHYNF